MDNREFNVKGESKEQLAITIKCLLTTQYGNSESVGAWYINPKKGFVLCSYKSGRSTEFTNRMGKAHPITEAELVDVLWDWLHGLSPKEVRAFTDSDSKDNRWDHKVEDSDVECELGWRLYNEDWGHVREDEYSIDHSSIAVFKPSWCWYGK